MSKLIKSPAKGYCELGQGIEIGLAKVYNVPGNIGILTPGLAAAACSAL